LKDSDSDEGLDLPQQLERQKAKVREAKSTIAGLIGNISVYKKIVEQEKAAVQEERDNDRRAYFAERNKMKEIVSCRKEGS
jgi:hypothetical protein